MKDSDLANQFKWKAVAIYEHNLLSSAAKTVISVGRGLLAAFTLGISEAVATPIVGGAPVVGHEKKVRHQFVVFAEDSKTTSRFLVFNFDKSCEEVQAKLCSTEEELKEFGLVSGSTNGVYVQSAWRALKNQYTTKSLCEFAIKNNKSYNLISWNCQDFSKMMYKAVS